ncbi:hypothetical protein CVT24_006181 [Panaeolus cyanescens]|uniref:BolA protein n=1 Tax=Panaeolus cyanescens TaxID=181874 RepID=A0A409V8P2_9AGAR|nr:hypothetical protein CVT24_006181 [Panaeolus cyanescens]
MGPVETSIREKSVPFLSHHIIQLTTLLLPLSINVSNDSWQHRHHSAMRAQGSTNGETRMTVSCFLRNTRLKNGCIDTDFSIQIVSNAFEKKTTIQRHRMIHAALADEFAQGLHALSLKTQTQAEAERAQTS